MDNINNTDIQQMQGEEVDSQIVQAVNAQLQHAEDKADIIVQTASAQIGGNFRIPTQSYSKRNYTAFPRRVRRLCREK